jgi:Phage integrase family
LRFDFFKSENSALFNCSLSIMFSLTHRRFQDILGQQPENHAIEPGTCCSRAKVCGQERQNACLESRRRQNTSGFNPQRFAFWIARSGAHCRDALQLRSGQRGLRLKVNDYYHNGARRRLRLHEKGGKEHEMPVHHLLEEILNEYIVAAGLQSGQPLFQSLNSLGTAVTGRALNRYNAWATIRKRAKAAGFLTPVGCHTWRATGITIYLENDGRLEHAQQMAGHESPRTTKLYDRTKDEITLSEVERIRL